MTYIKVADEHLDFFIKTIKKFKKYTNFPIKDNWKNSNNNDLWNAMVIQVMVVGGSDGAQRYSQRPDLIDKIKYSNLVKLTKDEEVASAINYVLRKAGVRYASKDLNKCKKTKSLVYNFKKLKETKNGFKGVLKAISEFDKINCDIKKVNYLMNNFHFLKSKSARDFLMGQGICTETIAIDIRIQNIFKKINIVIPNNILYNPSIYNNIEKEIIEKICKPLNIVPMQLDRILYQNYDKIMEKLDV